MRNGKLVRNGLVVGLTLGALLGGLARTADSQPLNKPVSSLSGWFHTVWGDRPPDAGEPTASHGVARYGLVDHEGAWTDLTVDEETMSSLGGLLTFNRQPVVLGGDWQQSLAAADLLQAGSHEPRFRVQSIQRQSPLSTQAMTDATFLGEAAVSGSKPWVTVLCRFSDSTGTTPHEKPWFDTLMLGGSYPGMDHYWRELSFDQVNLTGSLVVGWYNLPLPRSSYVYDMNGDGSVDLDHGKIASDCTAAADGDVYFPGFIGINLVFNQNLDCCAWGGSSTFALDGQTKTYNITWLPPWGYNNHGIIGHEMGHGFGLPHSSGPYSATYDSRWDVMSSVWGNCPPYDSQYGCVGAHTISYHKDFLGWIAPTRRYVAPPSGGSTIEIERLGQPIGTGYLMAKIPIGSSTTQFYTVETRKKVGYDGTLPGDTVVIHRVDTTRWDRDAQVVDTDGNGDPNDAGAMWLPGDTFIDTANGITVAVTAATATGFEVAISLTSGGKDVVIEGLGVSPTSVVAGGSMTVSYTVANRGTTTITEDFQERLYLSGDAALGADTLLGTSHLHTANLATGVTHGNSQAVTIPAGTAPGSYFLLVQGDASGAVTEMNEGNNVVAVPVTVMGAILPDLVVSSLSNPPTTAPQGGSFSVTEITRNQGTGTAGASTTRYRISTDSIITSADPLLTGSRSVPSLAAGANSSGTISATIPTTTPPGTYFLGACADSLGAVTESSETNNCLASTTTLTVTSGGKDVVIEGLGVSPTSVVAGGSMTVSYTVANRGTTTITEDFQERLYLSGDAALGADTLLGTSHLHTANLATGVTHGNSQAVTIPAGTAPGSYFLLVQGDASGAVTEMNEGNNVVAVPVTVMSP